MKTRFSKLFIAALALGAVFTGAYSLITGDAVIVGHRAVVSGDDRPDRGLPVGSSAHEAQWEARLKELDQKMVGIRSLADRASEPTQDRIRQLSLEIASLRSDLAKLADEIEARSAESEPGSDWEERNLTEEEKEDLALQRVEAQVAMYDELGAREGFDPDWAVDAQKQLHASFESLSERGIAVGDVVCHTTFCQADFTVALDGEHEVMRDLQDVAPWGGESLVWIRDVDQGAGVMYVAREGRDLPGDG